MIRIVRKHPISTKGSDREIAASLHLYDGFWTSYLSAVIGYLGLVASPGQNQARNLSRMACACLKSANAELLSTGFVILALMLPRVKLKAKVADKILGVLERVQDRSVQSLGAVAILYRCQEPDSPRVLQSVLNHSQVVFDLAKKHVSTDLMSSRASLFWSTSAVFQNKYAQSMIISNGLDLFLLAGEKQ